MTRNEIVSAIRSIVSDDHDTSATLDMIANQNVEWFEPECIAIWDVVTGARECAIECDAGSDVTDAIDALENLVRVRCDELDIRVVS